MNKKASLFDGFIKKLRSNKKLEIAVYASILSLAVVVFVLTGGASCKRDADETQSGVAEQSSVSVADIELQMEERLESILSQISGAGRVKVMLTLDTSSEIVTASDSKRTEGSDGLTEDTSPSTVSSGGNESPIILTEIMPSIRGVIIVAEGASNISVKIALLTAAQTVLGISPNMINVFAMEP